MIAVDTNILIYAHRADSPWHQAAKSALDNLAEGPWAVPWPCIHEFLAIVTHPRIFNPPTPSTDARRTVERWLGVPTVRALAEMPGYLEILDDVLLRSHVVGPRIHDARIFAICLQHGIDTLWSADRDFTRFAGLQTVNPLLAS